MSNKRDLKLAKYGVSKYKYRELLNFCLQYKEMIKEKNGCYYSSSNFSFSRPDQMLRGNHISNPTANRAERAIILGKDIELIEKTAIEAGEELYPYILKAVSEGLTWENLSPPCGRRQFYEKRRKFFYLLNLKKEGI